MTEYGNTNISAATDGFRPTNLQQRPPAATNNQPSPIPVSAGTRPERAETVVPSRPASNAGGLEGLPEAEMQSLVNQANLLLQPRNLEMVYRRHEGTNRYFVTIYDSETNEVAREIPPEWSLDLLARIWELTGIFMNERG